MTLEAIADGKISLKANNEIKVVLDADCLHTHCPYDKCDNELKRHITITDEGIIIDLVYKGEVVKTTFWMHDDLLSED